MRALRDVGEGAPGLGRLPARRLVMCAKSPWSPPIRREHALAVQALRRGFEVRFVEAPRDVRAVVRRPRPQVADRVAPPVGLTVVPRRTAVAGHRARPAAALDAALLARTLRRGLVAGDPVVVNLPWQWAAVSGLGCRAVFDAADDWGALIPGRRRETARLYRRIAAEADAVVVASPDLSSLFPGREVTVVPNGASSDLIGTGTGTGSPGPGWQLVYVGTLSERFDLAFIDGVLDLLPGWRLDLYGPCRYAGAGDAPSAALRDFLHRRPDQVVWHGALARDALAGVLDRADVGVVPHRPDRSTGQSSMKIFDYAARGLPIVSNCLTEAEMADAPPGTTFTDDPERFASAVRAAGDDTDRSAPLEWARQRTWEVRWRAWIAAVLGDEEGAER